MSEFKEYLQYDGVGLAQLIAQGEVSVQEVTAAAFKQIAKCNSAVNAVCSMLEELAQQQANQLPPSGILAGCPILIKDLLAEIAGVPTRSGSRLLAGYIPEQDSELIRRYRQAGLIFVGKTTAPELGLAHYTESELYGVTRNPWDLSRTPGGSSGGSAAAVATGMVPIAHGGDGGGSLRIPASHCGVFALKPSRGRSPCGPSRSEDWQGLSCEHALTRTVRDSAAMLDVALMGYDLRDAYYCPTNIPSYLEAYRHEPGRLRIAWTDQPFLGGHLHPDNKASLMNSLRILESLGHHVEEADVPLAPPEQFLQAMLAFVCGEVAGFMRSHEEKTGVPIYYGKIEPATLVLARYGECISAGELAWARRFAFAQRRIMVDFHQKYDVLVTPTLNQPPALVGTLGPRPEEVELAKWVIGKLGWNWLLRWTNTVENNLQRTLAYLGWPAPFNITGQPALSVPLYWNEAGLPIGTQIVGQVGDELTLLRLAHQLEQATPWAQRWPTWILDGQLSPNGNNLSI